MTVTATGTGTLSWSDIVRKGQQTQVAATRTRQSIATRSVKNKSIVLFEAENYMQERRARQAARILKRALHPETVLFEFNSEDLEKEDAYDLITKEVGEATGFRPISEFTGGNRGNLLIEAEFVNSEHAVTACKERIIHNGIQYLATPAIDGAEKQFVKVNVNHLPLENHDTLSDGLVQSMARYGKVCQIRLYTTARGYFEGEGTVILDCTATTEQKPHEELMPMLYLEKWDYYFLANPVWGS